MSANALSDADLGDYECECKAVHADDKKTAPICIIAGLVWCAFVTWVLFFQTGPIRPDNRLGLYAIFGAFFVAGIGFFVYGLVVWRRGVGKEVVVYDHGVTCAARGQTLLVRWRDVVSIKESLVSTYVNDLHSHTQRWVTLADTAGTVIQFVGTQEAVGFVADAVIRRAYGVIMPRALRRLAEGKSVALGPITVSPAGLETKEGKLPWDEVGAVAVEKGHLVLRARGRKRDWFKEALGSIENYRVLLAVWEERRPEGGGG